MLLYWRKPKVSTKLALKQLFSQFSITKIIYKIGCENSCSSGPIVARAALIEPPRSDQRYEVREDTHTSRHDFSFIIVVVRLYFFHISIHVLDTYDC